MALGFDQFVVQSDNEVAEGNEAHKVSSDDVEAAGVWARPLLRQPLPHTVPVLQAQGAQWLTEVWADETTVCRQVQSGHKETICTRDMK